MIKNRLARSKLELVLFIALITLAAWLRFSHLDQIEFLWDQAEIAKWAIQVGHEGQFTWIGPISSTNLDTFPGAIWLLAIPFALSLSPIFATGFIALLNVAAVVGCYLLTRHWFGRLAALVATALFAVSPWAVIYSRKIWHVELLAPFTVLYVFTGWRGFVKRQRWAVLVHFLVLALLVQIHFSALAFIPLTLLWTLLFWRRLDWRLLVLGGMLAALTFAPYFFQDAGNDWRNVQHFREMMQKPSSIDADALHATWVISAGLDLHWVTGPDRYPDFTAATPNVRWLFGVEGALVFGAGLLALGLVARRIWRDRGRSSLPDEEAAGLLLATWLVMPFLFQARHSVPVAPHYFASVFPAPFVLVGWLVARSRRLARRAGPVVAGFLLLLVTGISLAQIYEIRSLLRFVRTHDTLRGYGTPISYTVEAVRTAQRLRREMDGAEVILLSEGDEPRSYEMPAVADVLLYDVPHRAMDIRSALILPARPAVFWSAYEMTSGETLLRSFVDESERDRIPLREGVRSYRFYRWPGGSPAALELYRLDQSVQWANGARLIGYKLEGDARPGGALRWTLVWQPSHTPGDDVYYHWFNHLLDEEGQFVSQQDGPSLLPAYWRAGDTVLNWFEVPIPENAAPGNYTMRVGMYTYPALQNVPLLGQAGQEWAEIGPLSIGQ